MRYCCRLLRFLALGLSMIISFPMLCVMLDAVSLGGLFGSFLLVSLDGAQKGLCLRIGLEVLSDWLDELVDDLGHSWLEIIGMQLALREIGLQLGIGVESPE